MKGSVLIAEVRNLHEVIRMIDSRHSINMTSYSLVIDDVNVNDSSNNYQCAIFATNPLTDAQHELLPPSDRDAMWLTLQVLGKEFYVYSHNIMATCYFMCADKRSISSGPSNIIECSPTEQPSFTCVATGPNATNITWTYISSGGEEMNLTDGDEYQIVTNISKVEDGLYTTNSTVTFLNMAANESAIVRCKIDIPGAASADALLVTIGKLLTLVQ